MIEMVILDVDGTLMDTNYLHVEAWARAFHEIQCPIPRSDIHCQIGKGSNLMLDALLSDDTVKKRQADELHSQWYAELQQYGHPLPGAKELIRRLVSRRIPVWLATSAKSEELSHHIHALDAKDKLAGILSSADVEAAKPAPDIFQQALEKSGHTPEQCIVIGDTIWDIQAAQGSGLRIIAVMTGGAFSRQELSDAGATGVFKDCAELLASGFPEMSDNGN
jgi:HAD superfamily hydrolase (TIGR01509 family)